MSSLGGISPNVAVQSFTATATTAVSVVTIGNSTLGNIFRLTHDFHPIPATPFLYEVTVTIENISGAALTDVRYRRVMDWDIQPTAFAEFVTIDSGTAVDLAFVTDNGFDRADPLLPAGSNISGLTGDRVDDGPNDHGALFQFEFGTLAAGAQIVFTIYYGAASTELDALTALAAVGAEAFSLGQASPPLGDPTLGTPNTFIFGFAGIGGAPIVGQIVLAPGFTSNDVGTTHAVTATATEGGNAVVNTEVTFEVFAGPNRGQTAKVMTDSNGDATFTYTDAGGGGTDQIRATFVAPTTLVRLDSPVVAKQWHTIAGDVNGDGVRNALDAQELLRRLVFPQALHLIADMNGDQFPTNLDSSQILGVTAGHLAPPPDYRRLNVIDNGNGTVTVTGNPAAAPPGSPAINLINTTSGVGVSGPIQPAGSFGPLTITAAPGDRLTLDIGGSPARFGSIVPVPLIPVGPFQVGSRPAAVAVGHFNGDSNLDLVVANAGDNTLSILLGDGTGAFTPATPATVAVGVGPAAVAAGDFNGNGILDLAAANAGSNTLSILLGDGTGVFTPAPPITVGTKPAAVAVGHFNGDSNLDLAVANAGSNTLSILLGNGAGTFTPAAPVAVGVGPEAVAVADFNGDGKADIAVANTESDAVSVLLGNGDGTFQPARHYPAGSIPTAVAIVDLNGDTIPDVVVVSERSTNNLSQLRGDGLGNFAHVTAQTAGTTPTAIAGGDFDRDGTADLAVANGDDKVSIFLP